MIAFFSFAFFIKSVFIGHVYNIINYCFFIDMDSKEIGLGSFFSPIDVALTIIS